MTTRTGRHDGGKSRRRDELRDFLRSRRARVTPTEVGLPDAGRRRTPGLRREEVAVLAGVGLSWYTWLEQGRDITVTTGVLDAISDTLLLDEVERAHLYRLAGHNPPQPPPTSADRLPSTLPHLLDEWMPNPAYVLDRHWRFVAGNRAVREVFGNVTTEHSCLDAFGAGELREQLPNWADVAPSLVANLRASAARYPDDPEFAHIVARLRATSDEFEELWARHDVRGTSQGAKEVAHTRVGRLCFDLTTLQVTDQPDLRLVLLTPQRETGTRQRLENLLA